MDSAKCGAVLGNLGSIQIVLSQHGDLVGLLELHVMSKHTWRKTANQLEAKRKPHEIHAEELMASLNERVDLKHKVDLLKRVPLISGIDSSKLELLAFASETQTFQSGHILFSQGDVGDEAFVIVSGEVEVITEGPEGSITVATLGENQIIGEIAILIDVPRTATIEAMTDLTTLVISKDSFYRMVTEFPSVAIEIMRELASRVAQTTVQVRQVHSGAKLNRFSHRPKRN